VSPVRLRRAALVLLAATVVVASCGIGATDQVDEVDPDILARLEPTSTTTVMTEPPTSSPPTAPESSPAPTPPGSGDEPTTTTTAPPTTVPEPATTVSSEPLSLYFIDGSRLVRIPVDVPESTSLRGQLRQLEEGPPADLAEQGVRTAVPPDLVRGLEISNDYVTVNLDEALFSGIEDLDQRLIIGQIVLTLTYDLGFENVRFTLDGEPLRVFREDGTLGEPGETVGWNDYAGLTDDAAERTADSIADTTEPSRSSVSLTSGP
jgi:hypothetical protein